MANARLIRLCGGTYWQATVLRAIALTATLIRLRARKRPASVFGRAPTLFPSVLSIQAVRSRKGVHNPQPVFHKQAILHVLAPQRGTTRNQSAADDHRVVDREAVTFRQCAADVMGLQG